MQTRDDTTMADYLATKDFEYRREHAAEEMLIEDTELCGGCGAFVSDCVCYLGEYDDFADGDE